MYLIFTAKRPFNFKFYSSFKEAKEKEKGKNLPSSLRQIMKLSDDCREKGIKEQLNARLHATNLLPMTPHEEQSLVQKYAVFTGENVGEREGTNKTARPSDAYCLHLYLPKDMTIYTDGSFSNKFGGYAAVFLEAGRPYATISGCGLFDSSAEVEWKAVEMALSTIKGDHHHVQVYTDYMEIVESLYSDTKNLECGAKMSLDRILAFCNKNIVNFHHVKGHDGLDGSEWNELADSLAKHEKDCIKEQSKA